MKRKKLIAFLMATCIISATSATVYATFTDSVAVDSHISTGIVDIDLTEYQEGNNGREAYEDFKVVLPGDLISKIPTVTNKGEPCWLRAKIAYGNTSDTLDGFSDDNISGITEDWVKIGEYYYYKNILDKGETVDIFTGVTIPSTWTEEHADQSLAVGIVAEAIQAANYKPDFESMSPWGNEEIQLAVAESDGEETERLENVKLSVQFNGDAHKLVAAPSDFFQNFSVAMPGDVFTDSVELSNTTDRDAELFFNTEQLGLSGEQDELLRNLMLTISMDGQELYSGDLKAEDMGGAVSLGTYAPGQTGTLDFTVSVPKNLDNAFALRDADVRWVFTVNQEEPAEAGGDAVVHDGGSVASPVQTGDSTPLNIMLTVSIISGASAALLVAAERRKKS